MTSTSSLYGAPRPKTAAQKSTPSSLAFSSTLSSLLSQPSNSATHGRARPSKSKPDIFTTHNKGSKKRALADISSDGSVPQKHNADIGGVDAATLHRSKRKMEEKARLYASMKRGDYVPPAGKGGRAGENKEENSLVDFDRKWAEDQEAGRETNYDTSSDDGRGGDSDVEEELVEYEDDMGRTRKGTKAEAERERRRQNAKVHAEEELSKYSARPARPDNIVYGDTIQTAAFNPDDALAERMRTIAEKRDRSMTPPDEVHYDASKEVRSKGVGFYAFSQDKEGRQKEMEGLGKERVETERMKKEREERKEAKKRQVEERRREIGKKREKNLADAFLRSMDS